MDRTYHSPRDVSSASQEDVARALARAIRGLSGRRQFIYHGDFAYAGGRRGPLLMIGALRGAWREHVRRNASATGFASGECEIVDEQGERVLLLARAHGRGIGVAAVSTLNSRLMRGTGVSARFVEHLGETPAPATTTPAAAGTPSVPQPPTAPTTSEGTDPGALLKTILAAFADFKSAPTMAKLDALSARVAAWQALGEAAAGDARAAGQVAAIDRLLREKGRAYVASKQPKTAD